MVHAPVALYCLAKDIDPGAGGHGRRTSIGQFRIDDGVGREEVRRQDRRFFAGCVVGKDRDARYFAAGSGSRRHGNQRQECFRQIFAGAVVEPDRLIHRCNRRGGFGEVHHASSAQRDHKFGALLAHQLGAGIDFAHLRIWRNVAVDGGQEAARFRHDFVGQAGFAEGTRTDQDTVRLPQLRDDLLQGGNFPVSEDDFHWLLIIPIHSMHPFCSKFFLCQTAIRKARHQGRPFGLF